MNFTEKQRAWCIKTINNMYSWNLTYSFRAKFNPELEGYTDYFEKVKNNLCLDDVKAKLWSGEYKSVDEFVKELKLPFENAANYHGSNTVYGIVAEEILLWINEQTKFTDLSEDELWYKELVELQEKLENHLKNKPEAFCQSIIPR